MTEGQTTSPQGPCHLTSAPQHLEAIEAQLEPLLSHGNCSTGISAQLITNHTLRLF